MIQAASLQLPNAEKNKFIETIENELVSLHEGNFARYFVTPAQLGKWQNV
jgi:hypothetical protein